MPHATTLVIVELLPGSRAYCEKLSHALPIVVIDCGYTEIHLRVPGGLAGLDDLAIMGEIMSAAADCQTALVAYLD